MTPLVALFSSGGAWQNDNDENHRHAKTGDIISTLDEIMDNMDGFSSAEEAWLSSVTETLRSWRFVIHETYGNPEDSKDD